MALSVSNQLLGAFIDAERFSSWYIVMWDRGLLVQNVSFINFPSTQTQAISGPILPDQCSGHCGGEQYENIILKQIANLKFFYKKVG